MATNNSCDYAPTQYNVQVGGASGTLSSIAPSATSGIPLVSNGASSNPSFTTAVVAGGGTGVTSTTVYAPICGGTTTTGALQAATTGISNSGYVLTSTGSSSLPTFQAAAGGSITLTGDSGGGLTGSSFTITGGTSGALFAGAGTTLTESFNFLAMADTTNTKGYIQVGSNIILHAYPASGDRNIYLGVSCGNISAGANSSTNNTGIGSGCLSSITSGVVNTAIGNNCLPSVTTGTNNIAIGDTGDAINTGSYNICIGSSNMNAALHVTGSDNYAIGTSAMTSITTGTYNVGLGYSALSSFTTGTKNTCIGYSAGSSLATSDSSNVLINSLGTGGTSNVLYIGAATGTGAAQLNSAFICGITGIVVTGAAAIISSGNQLGVLASSKRFKHDIQDMADSSSQVMKLRPVTFLWNKDSAPGLADATEERQFGVIAEEAAEIVPSLVNYDPEGNPFSFKYAELPAILLNELQKALKRIEILEAKLGVK